MELFTFPLGQLETNCYVLADEKTRRCAIVDPGDDGDAVLSGSPARGSPPPTSSSPTATTTTWAAWQPSARPIPICRLRPRADTSLAAAMTRGLSWTDFYEDGDEISMDSITFRVLETPGHTPGSVCLLAGNLLFAGDTLFAGSLRPHRLPRRLVEGHARLPSSAFRRCRETTPSSPATARPAPSTRSAKPIPT